MNTTLPQQDSIIYQIAAEMMAAATTDADRARIDRALDLVGSVERTANPGRFLVQSQSNPNGAYLVDHGTCHCPDAAKRDSRNCKHSWAVRLFAAVERAEVDAEQADATIDADARPYELTGKGYLTLVWRNATLPNPVGTITRMEMPAHLKALADELCGPDPSAA